MTEPPDRPNDDRPRIHPREADQIFGQRDAPSRYTAAARALAAGNALFAPTANVGLEDDLARIGLRRVPRKIASWSERVFALRQSDFEMREVGIEPRTPYGDGARVDPQALDELWSHTSDSGDPVAALAFLRALLDSDDPLLAGAAASALFPRRKPRDAEGHPAMADASATLGRARRSGDTDAAAIAAATLGAEGFNVPPLGSEDRGTRSDVAFGSSGPSIMVHGTAAYTGDWWRPGGDFHQFIRSGVAPDLYAGPSSFSWSGAYRRKDRERAARDLVGWVAEHGGRVRHLYAHSYGGVIAQAATALGLKCDVLVLLSVPVENVDTEWRNVGRAVSLRIHMDLVLLAARRRQRFKTNVAEHHVDAWFVRHGDSHSPDLWQADDWAKTLGLQ